MRIIQPSSKRIGRFLEVPNLIELQLNSYKWFLEEGLPELFTTFSPIWDFTQSNYIELVSFTLGEPKYNIQDCRDRDMTYEAPIKAVVRFGGSDREVIESEVYLGDLPLMTSKGTFIINGRERVIVSQLSRSPGLYFEEDVDSSMQVITSARIIPNDGPWLDLEADTQQVIRTSISQTKKFPLTQLIKALYAFEPGRAKIRIKLSEALHKKAVDGIVDPDTGEILVEAGQRIPPAVIESFGAKASEMSILAESPLGTNEDILRYFSKDVTLTNPTADELTGKRVVSDILDGDDLIIKSGEKIERETAKKLESMNLGELKLTEVLSYIEATLEQDPTANSKDALQDIYKKLRPGDAMSEDAARHLIYGQFFEIKRYDLGKVGRRFLNQKLGEDIPITTRCLTAEDVAGVVFAMVPYIEREKERDDIDDLKNKRVKSVGELLQSQLRTGFVRMEKVAKERMTSQDQDNLLPSIILSVKPISASIKSFFSSNQLSTFMDQTNPLSEIVNKRRLSSLGPGGLQRNSAKLEVRDVHRSHYGRICPIETPEGPNIGLISQLTSHARVDEFGFIMTPYRMVVDGRVTEEIKYMTAQEETGQLVAPADTAVDETGYILADQLQARCAGGTVNGASYPPTLRKRISLMDVSPVQIISVATALIPFLENDDANRALMGANMQRQAVPLLRSSKPLVGTGYERVAAVDSGAAVIAHRAGTVEYVTSKEIRVRAEDDTVNHYELMQMVPSNKSTCFTHRPVVFPGQKVLKGDALADGACCDGGELALGKNVLVAFMPWNGYNYEDAILISERLVMDDVFTSIHIERHETEAVETKLGPEEITRDLPNIGEDALKDLDENGIIRIGAEVRPGDILVGKVAPKGQVDLSAEERLIIAIFGKKAEETRDVSLKLPHGERGAVVDVKVFSRFNYRSQPSGYLYKESKKRERLVCERTEEPLIQIEPDELPAGTNMSVQVFTATKRKLMVGDKMAGRHGNKGVISKVLPVEDMPFLNDGTPVDIVLNPLGVPSRMNIGQILETHLGYVGHHLGIEYKCPAFEGATETEILSEMERLAQHMRKNVLEAYVNHELKLGIKFALDDSFEAMFEKLESRIKQMNLNGLERISRIVAATPVITVAEVMETEPIDEDEVEFTNQDDFEGTPAKADQAIYTDIIAKMQFNVFDRVGLNPRSCKSTVRDGLTGDRLPNQITVGMIYMLKLEHLADEKIHARSTGPYSLVTQQPLGGKAQFGGQRFGEMEVWALEAYGAAYTLQELLTIKSDDVLGRVKAYESIVKGESMAEPGIPESFKILVNELRSLCLKVSIEDAHNKEIPLKDLEELGAGVDDQRLARSVGFFK